jgi:aminoglycoside phosphotransferase
MNIKTLQKSLPEDLARLISGYVWRQNHIGLTSVRVFHLEAENKKPLYLKINSRFSKYSLLQEKLRLDWLRNRLPVPKVLLSAEDENNEYLLLSEIRGVPAIDDSLKNDVPRVIEQLTTGLKMIHSLPAKNCPFDTGLSYRIEAARQRMINGQVEEEDFDAERLGRTAEDIFQEALATRPSSEDLVFTHGDYCVPNIILKNRKLSGFVDWAEAGGADRYQDIALLTRSVKYNFGSEYEKDVFRIYGIEPDWKKIYFYRLLDEFF